MNATFRRLVTALSLGASLLLANRTHADPLPGRDVLKFTQQPMFNTTLVAPTIPPTTLVFNGHDEPSTAYSVLAPTGAPVGYRGEFMADDFADKFASPVVHVKWWGSYLNRPTVAGIPSQVRRFLVSFESDIPASTAVPFSRPGSPLLNQIVSLDPDSILTPGSGTFTEKQIWPTSVDGPIYEYNAELHLGKEFHQQPDTVYWLKIVALVDAPPNLPADQRILWGWHNRDYTKPNPLASTPPAVVPGEQVVGALPTVPNPTRIWHFQDDAVNGFVNVITPPTDPMSQIMPLVQQDVRGPTRYQAGTDGPPLIAQFSKDLAFELYTVPEPATAVMTLASLLCVIVARRRLV
jgi:hypothetical protein